jgi:beta-galactosidase/beta-glucuronidase
VAEDGLFAYSSNFTHSSNGLATWNNGMPRRMTADSAVLYTSVEVYNDNAKSGDFTAVFTLYDNTGAAIGAATSAIATAPAGQSAVANASIIVSNVKLWNSAEPTMYTVTVDIWSAGSIVDDLNVTTGFRSLHYDSTNGFALNGEHFKVRGFCDHTNFAVVGMAIPPRINLFRAQASRAVGGNGRRTSHNPPDPRLLDIYDRVGIVVMDENRLFDNVTAYVNNMGSLVKRDRNHPAVIIWSFCNEDGCEGSHETGGPRFKEISYHFDGSRPVLANMFTFNDLLSNTIDVQVPRVYNAPCAPLQASTCEQLQYSYINSLAPVIA